MTSEEIAELLHVDPVTIRRLVNKGELSAYRIGADYRFAPSDLQEYLRRQRISAHAENESGTNPNNPLNQFTQLFRKVIQGKHTTPSELLNRFDRFTKGARHVLVLAQEEAQRFQHNYIGTEHLLLGLLREREGVAAQVLTNLGIEEDQARHAVEAIIGCGERIVLGEMVLTPRTKKVFEFAVDEAYRLNHRLIGTGHLLLGLIREGDGMAAGVLENFGLHLEQVRTETLRVLRQQHQGQEEAPAIPSVPSEATTLLTEDEPGLTCTSCGAHCPGYFRYCFNCGQPLIHEEESSHGEER
ncbi:MAG TPA: Clp protease N-terminal domain-containing protein [Ktedonobacteraceae bacterium]